MLKEDNRLPDKFLCGLDDGLLSRIDFQFLAEACGCGFSVC